ncbi:MAG: response regulator transcription factor [Anaerolineales bacterium]|nr:response regulator transcription factor [Anaerolineales bacterium]
MLDPTLEPQKILAVDDNTYTLRILEHTLESAGFQVMTAVSGREALNLINRHGMPHLAIVDWHMPGMSGIEFARTVREFSDLPIVMLTAVSNEDDIVRTIDQFAEDYIVKPFSPAELVARVKRVLRRMGDYSYTLDSTTRVDDRLLVNFPKREALVGGETISLTPTESKLLYILVRNMGRIVTTTFILNRLWPMEDAQEDRLHVHIHRLRRKIEENPDEPAYIIAERGTGYSFRPQPETT